MGSEKILTPKAPLEFIKSAVRGMHIYWTYHANMRLNERSVSREEVVQSVEIYDIIESYPDDKYLPSYLVWTMHGGSILHILFAADIREGNVRVVTAYLPDPLEWDADFKRRKKL